VSNDTWAVVDVSLDSNLNLLDTKWILKRKTKADGTHDKFKARLVVKGFRQIMGVDFHSTYAPVAAMTTVRVILALATSKDLNVDQLDISSAFLQAELSDDVYILYPMDSIMDKAQKTLEEFLN